MKISTEIQVMNEDIDIFNHMNYKRYIEHLENERAEWFRSINIPFSAMVARNIAAVILKLEVEYVKEAQLGERLTIKTKPMKMGTKSFSLKQVIYNENNEVMTKSICTFVMFDTSTRNSIPVVEEIARHFHHSKIT
ncbi:thioesterase family protein [Sporosarcina pasteurii]|uniref:Long-chain acyl-CoA thioesterase FadM n=1 Tax=Sporosarcina pasteurii TaxID=1474 RepID=A0A380C2A1_SPOPA|nr:acyl-CoA thioesterase [Sporosarcina pasteurii]MDS9471612.1 acyl-CoA thioesterase [Sporosarcina pasteurii]QBQ04778.1 acyl-CoA thioesterase [Sporosarcina pasteurii]SUJ11348.1 Long-chain acyl-CoA thioesterase FadM [Sporosarcina pasteurii]